MSLLFIFRRKKNLVSCSCCCEHYSKSTMYCFRLKQKFFLQVGNFYLKRSWPVCVLLAMYWCEITCCSGGKGSGLHPPASRKKRYQHVYLTEVWKKALPTAIKFNIHLLLFSALQLNTFTSHGFYYSCYLPNGIMIFIWIQPVDKTKTLKWRKKDTGLWTFEKRSYRSDSYSSVNSFISPRKVTLMLPLYLRVQTLFYLFLPVVPADWILF